MIIACLAKLADIGWPSIIVLFAIFSNKQRFISEILNVVSPLGEKFEFFIPMGIQIEKDFYCINTSIKLHSLKNSKNLKIYCKEFIIVLCYEVSVR